MVAYNFYLDEIGDFCCSKEQNTHTIILKGLEAKRELQKIDSSTSKNVQIKGKTIVIETTNTKVQVSNYNKLLESGDSFFLQNTIKIVHETIVKQQKDKSKGLRVYNKKIVGISSTIGTFALLALLGSVVNKEPVKASTLQSMPIIKEIPEKEILSGNIEEDIDTLELSLEPVEVVEIEPVVYLDFNEERHSDKGEMAYSSYYELVEKYATKWGIDPKLVMAILTQESAGKHTNLMQIEFDTWKDQILSAYNFNDNIYQNFVLTDNPENYIGANLTCITRQDLENPKTNISVGCIIFRQSFKYMNYHIGAGIQCYNFGVGNMNKALEYTATMTGITVEEIKNNQENLDFMNYTEIVVQDKTNQGDYNYLNHVMQYVENVEDGIVIKYIDSNEQIAEMKVTILPTTAKTM